MKQLLRISLMAALTGAAGAWAAQTLDALRWQKRVIVVFRNSDDAASRAARTLDDADGIEERDIAWFVIGPHALRSNTRSEIARAELSKLHQADGFEAVLIGKDGGVKARQTGHLDTQAFFARIDQMPMRRREMRQQ